MCNSEVTAPASKLTIEMICLPYHLPPSPLAPSQSGAKLTKGDKGEFYAYSVIPFAAAFVQSQEGGHQKSYTMPAHLSFFFSISTMLLVSFMQFVFSMPAVKRREVSSFSLST
jgi:hypothetical protein